MHSRNKLIQLIHIAKQQLMIDEMSYRTLLERISGKKSAKALTVSELEKVLHELKQKGFKVRSNRKHSPSTQRGRVKSNIAHKIRALWIQMHRDNIVRDGSEAALNQFVRGVVNPSLEAQGKPIVLN
uniref:gp16 family protein n=1 Tax=Daeguia caeni TaxID=439612 RepID=UPI0035BC7AEB